MYKTNVLVVFIGSINRKFAAVIRSQVSGTSCEQIGKGIQGSGQKSVRLCRFLIARRNSGASVSHIHIHVSLVTLILVT